MTPEEKKQFDSLKKEVAFLKNVITNIGGSLEFKTLVQTYARNSSKVTDIEIDGELNHDGSKIGFFGVTPIARQAGISDPSGGVTIDSQARTAINSILDVLDAYGLTL